MSRKSRIAIRPGPSGSWLTADRSLPFKLRHIHRHPKDVPALCIAVPIRPTEEHAAFELREPRLVPGVNDTVQRAQQGDQDAFHLLHREHVGRVYALCLRMAGDRAAAEELTQDVFVRAWQKLGTFRGESAFSTWLHRLAVNETLLKQRSAIRRDRRVTSVDDPEGADTHGAKAAPAGTRLDLEGAIGKLPAGARAVFVLHDVEGYEHQEIATLTGIAAGTSKAQLHRARRLLREALDR